MQARGGVRQSLLPKTIDRPDESGGRGRGYKRGRGRGRGRRERSLGRSVRRPRPFSLHLGEKSRQRREPKTFFPLAITRLPGNDSTNGCNSNLVKTPLLNFPLLPLYSIFIFPPLKIARDDLGLINLILSDRDCLTVCLPGCPVHCVSSCSPLLPLLPLSPPRRPSSSSF